MNKYRDDLVDVVVVASGTANKLTMLLSERIATLDNMGGSNKDTLLDNIAIIDSMGDNTAIIIADTVHLSDSLWDRQTSRELLTDTITATDGIHRLYSDLLHDHIQSEDGNRHTLQAKTTLDDKLIVSDYASHTLKDYLSDRISISSTTNASRYVDDTLYDQLAISDCLGFVISQPLIETIKVDDGTTTQHTASTPLATAVAVSDSISEMFYRQSVFDDTIKVGDAIWDRLTAKDTLQDKVMIAVIDEVLHDGYAIAWTMNTVNHAMSQYAPYAIDRLAVIDGVLYGECKDGIYRLDGVDETITGILITDKLDYGENLVKPSYAYTEYRTDGVMKLTVHTTQKGLSQSYTYALPKERARQMTNGRFVFGRGLYGRQFAYTLSITAKHAFCMI